MNNNIILHTSDDLNKGKNIMSMESQERQQSIARSQATRRQLFERQPLSIAGKIAFWAAAIGTLASIGGVTTLIILHVTLAQNTLISLVCWLISTGILASRFRWASLVSTLTSGIILYLLARQPYVIESLTHPNGPNGGYGLFAGNVLVVTCAILVFTCSIITVVQNYRKA